MKNTGKLENRSTQAIKQSGVGNSLAEYFGAPL